jgi:hypothetical protein
MECSKNGKLVSHEQRQVTVVSYQEYKIENVEFQSDIVFKKVIGEKCLLVLENKESHLLDLNSYQTKKIDLEYEFK